ncbi:response regulator [Paraburkholderia sp. CNPSo 3274]|uniref:ATP-binding protein n=1 Tax=Paraburkholderia sp. CNPSo 3274 TaxID=2940932 RepID=UPI0020B75301|nr:ATP-binding protein [Paraburkholderia sp. CNPSo 3274]MCP3707522.1 response regulator [Paraburkholderia sp. CNPSo 3274]
MMPSFGRRNSAPPTSPFAALEALQRNLRRERYVFAMLTGLLVFAALCMAAAALGGIGFSSLRAQALEANTLSAKANARLDRLYTLLGSAGAVLVLETTSTSTAQLNAEPTSRCATTFEGMDGSPDLRVVCEHIVGIINIVSSDVPIMLLRADGSAAYSRGVVPKGSHLRPAEAARTLADAALLHITARGTDPVAAAKGIKVAWFRPPEALGFPPDLVLGALPVLRNGTLYAFTITSVDLDSLLLAPNASVPSITPTLFGADGIMLAGALPPAGAQYIDRLLANLAPGTFHLLPRFGFALREAPLVHGFGHYMVALSWGDLFAIARTPVIIVLILTAALIAMLTMLSRYWNRQVLTRTYDEATRALESELLNHLLVHATPVGLCIVRSSNFEIVVANQIVRNVLGIDEHATRLPNALCVDFEKHRPWPAPAKHEDETTVYELPYSLERPGKEELHLAITYAPATMNREDVLFCAIADMSERYEVERLLREAKRMSDEAARAKVSFFAAMSHEIRTPLASLVGNIELVARGPLAPEQGARVQAMQNASAELLQIVSDVLDFSKIDVGQMKLIEEPGSIAALLVRIALAHAPLAVRQRLPFYLVMDRAIPAQVHFDAVRVAQIANNLLSNAFKFTRSGKIVLRARWSEGALEISVCDSGDGIPEDLKPHLFQPFTQGDAHRFTQARGTGLGLSICARLAQLMHGRVELDSALGVGTRAAVTLPLRPEGEATAGDEWTLPDAQPAILCRAPENCEWLANLFDSGSSTPTFLSLDEPPNDGTFDYLLVTDEFAGDDIVSLWPDNAKIVWLRQDGPLVPLELDDGAVVVSLYSLAGIRAATQKLVRSPPAAAHAQQPVADQSATDENFASLTALIAEDNRLNRALLRDQLRMLGATVIEAKDGEEAVARLDEQPVDLILTDLNMPGMNGYALLDAARAKRPHLPIYAVSSDALPEQIAQGRALGFTDYLTKPVPLAELARVLAVVSAQISAAPSEPATASYRAYTEDSESDPQAGLPRFPPLPPALADIFIAQAEHDIVEYTQIASQRDFARMSDWAHRVSGGLTVLGPSMINEACLELRATMREAGQWTGEVSDLAAAVAAELEALRALSRRSHRG